MKKLDREFYQYDAVKTAEKLIGKILVHKTPFGLLKGRIVETEAYRGPFDKAAHSYNNKGKDTRTAVQYKEGGYAYVYLIYGMYYCFNITTAPNDCPECVLVRALEPVEGIEIMKKLRKTDNIKNLCSGPGKLCMAMGIDKTLYGKDLCSDDFYLETDGDLSEEMIEKSKRINIDYAEEAVDFLWRFTLKDSKYVSVKPKNKR